MNVLSLISAMNALDQARMMASPGNLDLVECLVVA